MTNDTLRAHMKAYRGGTISLNDHKDMLEELVTRGENWMEAVDDLMERFDKMRDHFVEMISDE